MTKLLTEETALVLADDLLHLVDGFPRYKPDIARELLRVQKIGQMVGLSEALKNGCDCDFCDELKERLRELRVELEAIE